MFLNNKEALIRHDFGQYEAINLKQILGNTELE